jgi:broad specificity phosphatase PhoE
MSDTSTNCGFTESGIEITKKQAAELDAYDFDIALYGPIARVMNTKKIIMERPQKFEAVRLQYLHGIDNTGWEYKSFDELVNTDTFIARELENNMFARTPEGTSWGTVIANCSDVIDFINEYCAGKKVLLLSQGSVLRGMQILLRKRKHPWDDFTVEGMYHVGDDTNKKKNYGIIDRVF